MNRKAASVFLIIVAMLGVREVAARDRDEPADRPAALQVEDGLLPETLPTPTAATILANQPRPVVERLLEKNVVVMQEVREEGALSGGIITSYVMFEPPVEEAYGLLSQSARRVEFRPELTSIETIERAARGPIDEQRMRILFQRYVYRIEYRLDPDRWRIEWLLDERFDNDLQMVNGFWELYPTDDGRTLGRSGTSINVGAHVPGFLQDWITRKNLPKTMERVRMWVNSGGTYRP